MKTRKAFLPAMILGLIAAFGLTACNLGSSQESKKQEGGETTSQPAGDSGDSGEVSLGEIVITAAENKTDLFVGDTVQLTAKVGDTVLEGVEWKSRTPAVASVSDAGLVTALSAGQVKIRAEKDGYDTGSITINVSKVPEKAAHTVIDLEHADHYSPNDIWGMDLSAYGMGFMGPGDSPVEDNGGATEDGHSLGWLQQGCKETLTFTSNKAAEVEIGVSMAYNAEMNLATAISVKFNNVAIDMTGKVCEGPEDGDSNNYYDWHTTSFGKVNLVQGNNVLEIEMIGQGPNMDVFKIYSDDTALQIAVVEPAVKPQIVVTPTEKELEVGDTVQLVTATAGVSYESSAPTVASVSDSGLVTALAMGKATITVSKEGMKKASVAITVKAKPVAGQIVIEAEDAVLPEGTSIQLENGDNCSGGKSLGYFSAEQSFELKYTATEAKEYKLSIVMSSAVLKSDWSGFDVMAVSNDVMTVKFNDAAIDLGTIELPGSTGWTKTWKEVELGNVTTKVGENVFAFAALAQAPNIDCIKLTDPNAAPVTPVVNKYTVSFDANGGTGEMTAAEVDEGAEYTLPANGFTAPANNKEFAGWEVTVTVTYGQWSFDQTQVKQPGEKITVSKDMVIKASWKVVLTKSEQIDLSSAFVIEAEDATPTVSGQQCVPEDNESSHGGKDVGYMSTGAALTFNFNASAAGKVKLILMGRSASANWMSNPVTYYDHSLEETTSIKVNGTDISLTNKGFLGSDAKTSVQVDLGEIDVVEGANTIVITAIQQAPNFDCIALISDSITFTVPTAA